MAMKETTKEILNYLKGTRGQDVTAQDVADALGLGEGGARQVVGSFNSFVKKGWGIRIPAETEVTNEDGSITHKQVKLLELTDLGMSIDPDAEA